MKKITRETARNPPTPSPKTLIVTSGSCHDDDERRGSKNRKTDIQMKECQLFKSFLNQGLFSEHLNIVFRAIVL